MTGLGAPRRAVAACGVALVIVLAGCATTVAGSAEPSDSMPATTAEPAPRERVEIEILDRGFTSWEAPALDRPLISWAVVVRNPNPDTWLARAADLTITFSDSAGAVVASTDLPVVLTIQPGAKGAAGGGLDSGGGIATSMSVRLDGTEWVRTDRIPAGSVTMGPATTRPDTSLGADALIIDCDARSTYRLTPEEVSVAAVYRDAAGVIIGGTLFRTDIDSALLSFPAQATTPMEFRSFDPPPSGVPAAECYPVLVGPG